MELIDAEIVNQRDEVTQKGEWTVMVKRRTGCEGGDGVASVGADSAEEQE